MLQKSYLDNSYKQPSKNIHQKSAKDQILLRPFIQLYYFLVAVGAVPVRLLFHKNFGERSITPLTWAISLGFHIWYVFEYAGGFTLIGTLGIYATLGLNDFFNSSQYSDYQGYAMLSLLLINGFFWYIIVAFFINGRKVLKNISFSFSYKPVEKNSYNRGEPIYLDKNHYIGKEKFTFLGRYKISEDTFRILIEPQSYFIYGVVLMLGLFLIAAFLVAVFDSFFIKWFSIFLLSVSSVGVLILLSSICLFLEEYGYYERVRHSALDIIDGEEDLKLIMETKKKLASSTENINNNISKEIEFPVVHIY